MASAWIFREERENERTGTMSVRWRVFYRLGGRGTKQRTAGSFPTERLAKIRRNWLLGELAAQRVPNLELAAASGSARTLREVAETWRTSRIDVAAGTAQTHKVNLNRILPTLGTRPVETIGAEDVVKLVTRLHADGLARESIRKTVATFAMVLDFAERSPNPARDKRVLLPAEDRPEVNPPSAAHVESVYRLLPSSYKLALLTLDATGMRVSELEALTWGDVDEPKGRWRVSRATAKTKQGRWVPVPAVVFRAVVATVPRDDRVLSAQVFAGFGADRLRTAITRACKASGIPAYSPHDLRHRRASLWHLSGVPAAEAASWLGHSAQEHLRTYAHVVMDRAEVDYESLISAQTRAERATPVIPTH